MSTRIIYKKKKDHGGHHGGAWKVAYADFVTAMMALFIVLWLLNSKKEVQEAIGGYFKDPSATSKKANDLKAPVNSAQLGGLGENLVVTKEDMPKLKEELEKAMHKLANFEKISKNVEITVTEEGLRIELLEQADGTFFDVGNAHPRDSGKELLSALASEIGKLKNRVSIEGHTDSKPYNGEAYSNWELSVDRANAARRIMQGTGLGSNQVSQVRGYADQRLRNPKDPNDPANRRISVIVHYLDSNVDADKETTKATPEVTPGEQKTHAGEPAASSAEKH